MNIIQKNKMKLINKKYMKKNTKNTKNTKKKVGGADGPVKIGRASCRERV